MQKVYFDNAATTPLHKGVVDKMTKVLLEDYGNPSSTHGYGRSAKNHIEKARRNIALRLGVKASEIIFTSGGTEADNLVLNSVVRDLGVRHIITSKIEHHAVLHTVQEIVEKNDVQLHYLRIRPNGAVDYEHLKQLLETVTGKTLVTLMHVNNEVGTILDVKRVGLLCKEFDAFFHSDMVQSIGHFEIDLYDSQVDFTAASAHKFHGPKGVGFVYIRKNTGIRPLIYGGEQERGYRGGTESVHNIVGMDEALKLAYDYLDDDKVYIQNLKKYFIELLKQKLPGIKFNAGSDDSSHSTYTLINICLPITSEKAGILLFQLDIKGIACSRGSACQSGSSLGSHVLTEILSKEDMAKPSVRFSFSKYNTREEVDYVVRVLKEFCEK